MDSAWCVAHLRVMRSSQRPRTVRAFRGATTVAADQPLLIREAVQEMIDAILDDNDLTPADIISAVFTATPDLVSEFPAHAARLNGWTDIPLLCAQELPVVGALPRCLRVMVHAETSRTRGEVRHVYLRDAILLRSDLLAD
jgi:chorismate mutase